jgi:hypothetical protein
MKQHHATMFVGYSKQSRHYPVVKHNCFKVSEIMSVAVLHPTPSFLEHRALFRTTHGLLPVLRGHPCCQEKMNFYLDSAPLNLCARTVGQINIEHEKFMMLVQLSRS